MAIKKAAKSDNLLKNLHRRLENLEKKVRELERKTKYCDGASLPADAAGPWDD